MHTEAVETTPEAPETPWLEVTCAPGLTSWMAAHDVALACTTYQTGKLLLLGRKPDLGLSIFERNFTRCMGLYGDGQTLWMSSQFQFWRIENMLRPRELYQGHDRLFVPKVATTTGDLDIHDVAIEATGRPVFVVTGFNCLGTLNDRYSFTPLWRPKFITELAAEDRCHMNGLAMQDGWCRYVTAVATTNDSGGWRRHRRDGGVVIDVPSGEVVATGLSMPHSPRLHRGDLWLLNSGTGFLGKIDRDRGKFEPVAFCPGYLRGLTFVGEHHAVVTLSRPRHDETFGGLELDESLDRFDQKARCGLLVIDLRTGRTLHWVRMEGEVSELYDVVALPGVARPMAFGTKSDDIRRILSLGDAEQL